MAYSFQSLRTSSTRARVSLLRLGAAGALAAAVLAGCSDPAVERQARFDAQFADVSAAYSKLLGELDILSGSPSEESLSSLRSLVGRARGLSGGSSAQDTAARTLAANMSHTAALAGLMRATTMESDHETRRGIALSANALAAELEAIAAASAAIDLAGDRAAAQAARDAAGRSARGLRESIQAVEAPIGQLSARMSESAARLSELNQETAVLLRKARESNPRTALAFVEEASTVRGSLRTTRTALETDAIATGDLAIEKSMQEGKLASAQQLQAAAGRALDLLAEFEADVQTQTAKTVELARELRKQAQAMMRAVADERAGALRSAYEQIAEDLSAVGASAGSLADAVATDEIRAALSELAGLGSEGRMLLASGDAGGVGEIKAKAESLLNDLREKVTSASDRLGAAEDEVVPSQMRGFLEAVKRQLDGMTVESLLSPPAVTEAPRAAAPARSAPSTGRSLSGASLGQGSIDDIDAFMARYNEMLTRDPVGAGAFLLGAVDESKPGLRVMKRMTQMSAEAMRPMVEAMVEKFGIDSLSSLSGGMGAMGGGVPGMGGLASLGANQQPMRKKSDDGSRAVFVNDSGDETAFVKSGGKWMLDLGELAEEISAQAEGLEQMAPMMEMAMGPMKTAAATVAARIRSGELTSADEVMTAFQTEIMSSFGGGGGAGGRRGR